MGTQPTQNLLLRSREHTADAPYSKLNDSSTVQHRSLGDVDVKLEVDVVSTETCDFLLAYGRRGETIAEMKAGNADSVAVLAAFVLAFVLQRVHDDADDVDDQLVAWYCLLGSASSGLCAVLLMTFTSCKIHRLVGRSWFCFGQDTSAEELARAYGGLAELQKVLVTAFHVTRDGRKELMMPGRRWYQVDGGRQHFGAGLFCMVLELCLYMVAMAATTVAVQPLPRALTSVGLLTVPSMISFWYMHRSGALHQLA